MASKANQAIQKKQWIFFGSVLAGLMAVAIGASVMFDNSADKKAAAVERPKTQPLSIGVTQTEKEAADSKGAGDVVALRKMLAETQQANDLRNKELEAKLASLQKLGDDASRKPSAPPAPGPAGGFTGSSPFQQGGATPPPPENRATGVLGASPNARKLPTSLLESVDISPQGPKTSGTVAGNVQGDVVNSAQKFGQDTANRDQEFNRRADDDPLSPNRGGGRNAETYIPAGTYIRAVLLNGLDAPTGGQSQQNPHPVLLQLADDAVLPNKFRAALKNCMVTANGYGDIAAERAYIRSDRLSCIDENGGAIDVRLTGYIAGEDGKTGMRGRVVEKTGRILANAIFASLGSGIGQAFKQSGVSQNTNALGGTSETVTDGFKAGFGTGISKSFDRLSEYYIRVAEKLFPVIEVNGGRVVDIVVTKGVAIERTNKSANSAQP